jgi:hypothetical protein
MTKNFEKFSSGNERSQKVHKKGSKGSQKGFKN